MPAFDLSNSLSAGLLFLAALLSGLFTALFYRKTLPPVSPRWRSLLAGLRFLALFSLIFLIGEPLLSVLYTFKEPPSIVVLVDNSESMTIAGSEDPKLVVASIVESSELSRLASSTTLHWVSFDKTARSLTAWAPESLSYDGDRTDHAGAFSWLKAHPPSGNLQACIVITDGNPTSQVNPVYSAEALGVPVYTVGVGDTTVRKDLLVSGLLSNSVAYAGKRVPVQVTVRNSGYSDTRADVTLSVQNRVVDRSVLSLGSGDGELRTTLFMTPDSVGTIRGEVTISRLDGETTYRNNSAVFFTKVLSGKRTVLLLAGRPDPDVAFIRRALEADSNISVITRVERLNGSFLEGNVDDQIIRKSDALFLVGFPGPYSTDRVLRLIARDEFRLKPIFFMLSSTLDYGRLRRLEEVLPVSAQSVLAAEIQSFLSVQERARLHPLLSQTHGQEWESLPPLFRPQGQFTVRTEALVLGTTRLLSQPLKDPLLVVRSVAGQRSVALLGYGIWRWKLLSPEGSRPDALFDVFVTNVVQWLTAIDDQRRFRVFPSRASFSALEPVVLRAEVYDESMHPLSNAEIRIDLRGEEESSTLDLLSVDNGQYEGSSGILPPGEYRFVATARAGGFSIGEDRGSFTVGGQNAEFLETRQNSGLLRNIASRTGGVYRHSANLDGLADEILSRPNVRARTETTGSQIELRNSGWVLGFILMLLSSEWFLRKRLGLL